MPMGQHAAPHSVWVGVDNGVYLICPKSGITPLPQGKETTHCPSCAYRIAALTNLITDGTPEYEIQEKEY